MIEFKEEHEMFGEKVKMHFRFEGDVGDIDDEHIKFVRNYLRATMCFAASSLFDKNEASIRNERTMKAEADWLLEGVKNDA